MSKANEPAYPLNHDQGTEYADGLSKRDKLAMEIYANKILVVESSDEDYTDSFLVAAALHSIRAADIFFEELESFNQNKVK